jgi:hypothetical protein
MLGTWADLLAGLRAYYSNRRQRALRVAAIAHPSKQLHRSIALA